MQHACELHGDRNVVERITGCELIQEPKAPLGERRRVVRYRCSCLFVQESDKQRALFFNREAVDMMLGGDAHSWPSCSVSSSSDQAQVCEGAATINGQPTIFRFVIVRDMTGIWRVFRW